MNSFEQFKYSESLKIIWLFAGFILLERMIGRQKSKDYCKLLPRGHRRLKLTIEQRQILKKWIDYNCQLTLDDLANRVRDTLLMKLNICQ